MNSPILFLTVCSNSKLPGGQPDCSLGDFLMPQLALSEQTTLLRRRRSVLRQLRRSTAIRDRRPLGQIPANARLKEGPDFGGREEASYLPAACRYDGRFWKELGNAAERLALLSDSPHHVLILSGLYGLMHVREPIQNYNFNIRDDLAIQRIWTAQSVLTDLLLAYIARHGIQVVYDLTGDEEYRALIHWPKVRQQVRVLHARPDRLGTDGLPALGALLRDSLLPESARALLWLRDGERLAAKDEEVLLTEADMDPLGELDEQPEMSDTTPSSRLAISVEPLPAPEMQEESPKLPEPPTASPVLAGATESDPTRPSAPTVEDSATPAKPTKPGAKPPRARQGKASQKAETGSAAERKPDQAEAPSRSGETQPHAPATSPEPAATPPSVPSEPPGKAGASLSATESQSEQPQVTKPTPTPSDLPCTVYRGDYSRVGRCSLEMHSARGLEVYPARGPEMYPAQIPPDTHSDAEKRLFKALRDHLTSHYTVFHGKMWRTEDAWGKPTDGESDFVIAHPGKGILVVEVKGGGIVYDARKDEWWSIDRHAVRHPLKSPITQARDGRGYLKRCLRETLGPSAAPIAIGYAVALPDTRIGPMPFVPELEREITLDGADLEHVLKWVEGAMSFWLGRSGAKGPIATAISALRERWGRSVELPYVG